MHIGFIIFCAGYQRFYDGLGGILFILGFVINGSLILLLADQLIDGVLLFRFATVLFMWLLIAYAHGLIMFRLISILCLWIFQIHYRLSFSSGIFICSLVRMLLYLVYFGNLPTYFQHMIFGIYFFISLICRFRALRIYVLLIVEFRDSWIYLRFGVSFARKLRRNAIGCLSWRCRFLYDASAKDIIGCRIGDVLAAIESGVRFKVAQLYNVRTGVFHVLEITHEIFYAFIDMINVFDLQLVIQRTNIY